MRVDIRDRAGKLLGWHQQVGNRINGYVRTGGLVGWYNPANNATYDRTGYRIGYGELLASLIVRGK